MKKVHLRKRLSKSESKEYLYLEIYYGYARNDDGGIKANRKRQKLDYWLHVNPRTPEQRTHNKETIRKAEIARAELEKDVLNKKYGYVSDLKGRINFIEYFRDIILDREGKGNKGNWESSYKHLVGFAGEAVAMDAIDEEFCEGFKRYLTKEARTKSDTHLSSGSIASYYTKLRAALNQAVDEGYLMKSPARNISTPKIIEHEREYLTEVEVRKLFVTECRYDVLKRAFLFSCLTGLRWSDIQNLEWSQVQQEGDKWKIIFHQQKTKGLQYHYIGGDAVKLLGNLEDKSGRVFIGLKYSAYMNVALAQWVLKAGITKHITFHCARHTYATMLLTKSVDLYTVSKLLGHNEVKTTQIYAKIIDQKKIDAVDTLNILSHDE